jgi:hypothetical protein
MEGFCSLIAQLVERRTVNPQVPGSSPGRGATNIKGLLLFEAAPFVFLRTMYPLFIRFVTPSTGEGDACVQRKRVCVERPAELRAASGVIFANL